MTTATATPTTKTQTKWRPSRYFEWAEANKYRFLAILPEEVCEAALATCRFQLRGKNSHGNEYGKGFLTFMQTYGNVPAGLANDVQIRHHWIELDAHDSADLILACFGLSTEDVYAEYGIPAEGETVTLDLYEIVNRLA